jgi:ABC-type Zn uptake system ZnuABC Zn-binding protein ZnuA/ABC-type Mn2+/Zn2+ transport system permease subunit
VTGDGKARVLLDSSQRRLEALVRERFDPPALVADEVVMMVVRELNAFVVRAPVAKVDLLHELLLGEQVDHAIDARDADLAALRAKRVHDLGHGQAAVAVREHRDDRAPGRADAVARVPERLVCLFLPGHTTDDNDSRYRVLMLEPFRYAFVQRGLWEVLLLSGAAGLIGTWIVLRGLAFYAHAIGTATFPGLVVADGLGFAPLLGAFGAAAVFALAVAALGRRRRDEYQSFTALVLVGALALGVILASDVFHSGSNVETLLFGSLLLIGDRDLVVAAAASALAIAATIALGRRWLATGFDPATARALGARSALPEMLLLVLVAVTVVASLATLGALLVSALLVLPAATARLWTRTLRSWQLASIALAAAEGTAGLWLAFEANVPPGAAIAVIAGGVFALAALPRVAPVVAAATLLLAGCGATGNHASVVATTTQIGDWTGIVAGDAVSVHQILQPNTDPHEYEPRPADVQTTSGAMLVLENGDGLDHWMPKVVSSAGGHPQVVNLGEVVPITRKDDPHWWHDPRNAEAAVLAIRDALVRAEPSSASIFRRNAAAYEKRLHELDRHIAACFETVPRDERKLVTDHDAFGYFAHRYGIRIIGAVIPSLTTAAQPSAGETAKLIAQVRREHVRAIFPESSINPRLAQTVARATGASAKYTLYGDTLGPDQTYLEMERANANAMIRGFTGGQRGCPG